MRNALQPYRAHDLAFFSPAKKAKVNRNTLESPCTQSTRASCGTKWIQRSRQATVNGDSSVDEASTPMDVDVRRSREAGQPAPLLFLRDVPVIYSRSFSRTWPVRSVASLYVKLSHTSWLSSPGQVDLCARA